MRALVLDAPGTELREAEVPAPELRPGQVRIRVGACGVCRTDLHIRDGELPDRKLPLILGHQIVGTVIGRRSGFTTAPASAFPGWGGPAASAATAAPDGRTCATVPSSPATPSTVATPRRSVADVRYCFPLPEGPRDAELAPLLCAGLIGYRALRAAGDGEDIGLYGFGAAAHIVAQVAIHEGRRVFAFTRQGDDEAQSLARELGAEWAGAVGERPEELDAAIIFAPAGELVPEALRQCARAAPWSVPAST